MAITAANLTASYSGTDATSYATASVAPGSNRLILLTVNSESDLTETPNAPTASGCGVTWVEVATLAYDTAGSRRGRITLLRGMVASPSSGAITIDFAGQTQSCCLWTVEEFDGVNTGGTNGSAAVVQSATVNSTGSDAPSVTLAAFADASNNAAYGAFAKEGNPPGFTKETGYTLLSDVASTTPVARLSSEWILGEDTSVSSTAPSTNQGGGVACEIAAGSAAHLVTLTAATETDAAQTLTVVKPIEVTLTPTAETDAAVALAAVKPVTVTPATETDAAQALVVTQDGSIPVTLTPVTETDAAQTLVVVKTILKTLTPAVETDAAQTVAAAKSLAVTAAGETDAAQALAPAKAPALAAAAETDSAQPLSALKPILVTLTPATETDTAVALTMTAPPGIGVLTLLDAPLAVCVTAHAPLAQATVANTLVAAELTVGHAHIADLEVDDTLLAQLATACL